MGAPSWSGAATTPAISEQPLAAVALVGAGRTVQRATALFLDCCGSAEAFLSAFETEIDSVLGGEVDQATARLDRTTLDISAFLDENEVRCALLTIARPADHGSANGGVPLLEQAIDSSSAIVWVKDLDGRYVRVNGKYVEQLKVAAEHVCGKTEGELAVGQSIEGLRWRDGEKAPLELEYTVDAAERLPAFAVLRFALRDLEGKPLSVCGVAAPLTRAGQARSECERLMRLERWSRSDEVAIRAEVIAEWGLTGVGESDEVRPEPRVPEAASAPADGDADHFAALAGELDAALETSARLDRELAEERRQVMVLREASALAARRAHELLRSVTTERTRAAELEEALTRAEARASELEGERDSAHARAEELEAAAARAQEAKLSAEKTQAELAKASAALAREQRAAEGLRAELRAAEEEVERVRRAATEAVAQAPTQDELEEERRRADRASAALAAARARSELAEAEAKSALAQARAELRRAHEDAAATTEALNAEKLRAGSLGAELGELRDELARERDRVAAAEVAGEEARREASELAERIAELEQARSAGESSSKAAGTADKRTIEKLRRELASVRDELGRTQQAVAERPSAEELEQERARAEEAEAAAEQSELAREEARGEVLALTERLAKLERAQKGTSSKAAAGTADKRTIEKLRGELAAAREELERLQTVASAAQAEARAAQAEASAAQAEASAAQAEARAAQSEANAAQAELEQARTAAVVEPTVVPPAVVEPNPEPAPVADGAAAGSPAWAPAAQRALAAALAETPDWRTALKQSVKIIGVEGEWDAVAAWCPDGRQGFLKCAASWAGDAISSHTFETQIWQHRQKLPPDLNGSPKALVGLEAAQDALLKAAAGEGMGSSVFVPIRDGDKPIAMLQLLSRRAAEPSSELVLSLEGIALQLASIARLLNSASTPQWRVGRL